MAPAPVTARAGSGTGEHETSQILWWLVFLRVVVSVFILGTTFLLDEAFRVPVFTVVVVNVLVTLALALLIPAYGENRPFVSLLVFWDFLFVAALIALTGVSRSIFSFLFLLAVINAGILLSRRTAFLAATLALLVYTAVLCVEVLSLSPFPLERLIDPSVPRLDASEMIYKVLLHSMAFYMAAFLSSYISGQSRIRQERLVSAQREIAALRALYENIVASVPMGILTFDRSGQTSFSNSHAARLLGQPRERIKGRALSELIPELSGVQSEPRADNAGHGMRRKLEIERGGQESLYLQIFRSDLRNSEGARIGQVVLLEDQSALHKMEEEVKRSDKLAAVGKMAAGIAHEIRNPLAAISGSIQLLKGELELNPLDHDLMEIVVRETDRLNKLISEFLAFARPAKIDEEIVDLSLLINDTIELCRNDPAYSEAIRFRCDLTRGAYLRADADQLRQLFWNLFLNSMQAMPRGGQIEVVTNLAGRSNEADPLPKQVQIKCSDSGRGIESDVLPKIFDPFFTTKESGTGLGLTTAYRIVENHNGSMTVESRPGLGTTFYIALPLG